MNFLAHVQLSGGNAKLITGNLIADAYKGSSYKSLTPEIQVGVRLHRKIDEITDTNPDVLAMKKIVAIYFNRYAAIALDVYFDHFLSVHWEKFNNSTLSEEIVKIHKCLVANYDHVNLKSREFLEKLIKTIHQISIHPFSSPASVIKKEIRRCVISKQTTIYYRVSKKEVEIITIQDTRRNPNFLHL